jgi:uncharacterized repeat protein (TIGR01451 family)
MILPSGYSAALNLTDTQALVGGALLRNRIPSVSIEERSRTEVYLTSERASATENALQALSVDQFRGPAAMRGIVANVEIEGTVVEHPPLPPGKFVLCKSVDKQTARVGDVVTFSLRYSNMGGQAIQDVAVVDSLTGRLEFIPGSAKTDRAASFSMLPNDAGSLQLRWEISGKLLPGGSGLITFQARVR